MQVDNKLLDDLARVAAGAAGAVAGVRDEVEAQMRQRMERLLARMDVVSREEFEVVREIAANARHEQEVLSARLTALERHLSGAAGKPSAPPAAKRRAAARPKKAAAGESDGESGGDSG